MPTQELHCPVPGCLCICHTPKPVKRQLRAQHAQELRRSKCRVALLAHLALQTEPVTKSALMSAVQGYANHIKVAQLQELIDTGRVDAVDKGNRTFVSMALSD